MAISIGMVYMSKRGRKLNVRQVVSNNAYSRTRCQVEQVFGSMHNDIPEQVMRWLDCPAENVLSYKAFFLIWRRCPRYNQSVKGSE